MCPLPLPFPIAPCHSLSKEGGAFELVSCEGMRNFCGIGQPGVWNTYETQGLIKDGTFGLDEKPTMEVNSTNQSNKLLGLGN